MIGFVYSLTGILAIIITITINRNALFYSGKDESRSKVAACYSKFLWIVFLYFLTDTLWGILDEFGLIGLLRLDTFIYYIAMALAVVLWCDYVVAYLHQDNVFGKVLMYFGRAFVVFEFVALIINFYNHFFFWFDNDGTYHAGAVRYVALYIQIVMFVIAATQAVFVTIRTRGKERRRHLSISLFGFAMVIAIVAQIFYPLLPIYTIGYLIGTCFLHVFIEEDEKDENLQDISKKMDIISSMAGVYFCSYYIDMTERTFTEIDNKIPENDSFIGKYGDAEETLNKVCNFLVLPQYKKEMLEFVNLDTLDDRLTDKKYYISRQFESIHIGWAEGFFIASDRDENGKLKHAIWAIRTINDEKAREQRLFYNSYIDELTGLYNRKMYMEDIIENLDKFMNNDFVYVSMDVNGLKNINDTKGHAAGDELISGAAACMKEAMGQYGKVYRTGGDEFIAMLNADSEQLAHIKERFEELTSNYKGNAVDEISVSCGYVVWAENLEMSIIEIQKQADKNMYLNKQAHYASKGIDRRSQQNAYKALCALYTKILTVNLTENKYNIISMNENEQSEDKGFSDGIFEWLENFAKSGQVHEDDVELYLSKTNREYLTNYFKQDKTSLSFTYRRMINEEFKLAEMEMIPSESYTEGNQNIYLYVKAIDK